MRRTNTSYGEMLYSADGYVTAWFMYYLQNDIEAGEAFIKTKNLIFQSKIREGR